MISIHEKILDNKLKIENQNANNIYIFFFSNFFYNTCTTHKIEFSNFVMAYRLSKMYFKKDDKS